MYVLKVDIPSGRAFFTGKKKVVQGCEFPGLTSDLDGAKVFETEDEAKKFCKMLIKKYDMDFYYSALDEAEDDAEVDTEDFVVQLSEDIEQEIDARAAGISEDQNSFNDNFFDSMSQKDVF